MTNHCPRCDGVNDYTAGSCWHCGLEFNGTNRGQQMTRRDIEREFTVKDGQIVSKGKFEGEPIYAPYFAERDVRGEADEETPEGDAIFRVTDADRRLFPELGKAKTVYLAELDSGHVATTTRE